MIGAGRYDPECLAILDKTQAVGVILVVIQGNKGSGFSLNCLDADVIMKLPQTLRMMADEIEADTNRGKGLSA